MSHEMAACGARFVYSMPVWPSDMLRSVQFAHFFESHHGAPFLVQTRDGWSWSSSNFQSPAFTVTFSSRQTLDAVIDGSTEDALARVFLEGDVDIQGDIFTLLTVAEYVLRHSTGISRSLIRTLGQASIGWFKRLSSTSENAAVASWRQTNCSLNLAAGFFQPWLGDSLANTCADFRKHADLEAAQTCRLEQICDALDLQPEDRLLDANCGWGNLLLYAGERVASCKGNAASEQQASIATDRILHRRMRERCHAVWGGEKQPEGLPGSYDKIVDAGVFDQVAHSHFAAFLTRMHRLLAPGGRLLLHRVTRSRPLPRFSPGPQHAEVASASDLTSLSAEMQCAESVGLRTLSIDDLGEQYRRTLRIWIDNLQHNSRVYSGCDEYKQYRSWLFYLLDTVTNLETGTLQLHQLVFSRPPEMTDDIGFRVSAD